MIVTDGVEKIGGGKGCGLGKFVAAFAFLGGTLTSGFPNPAMALTETITVFGVSAFLHVLADNDLTPGKKMEYLLFFSLALMCCRPTYVLLFFGVAAGALFLVIRKCLDKRILKRYVLILCGVVTVNLAVHYRETGQFVIFENYGAIPAYQANNANTKTISYSSALAEEFTDDFFLEVYNSNSDTGIKNRILY